MAAARRLVSADTWIDALSAVVPHLVLTRKYVSATAGQIEISLCKKNRVDFYYHQQKKKKTARASAAQSSI